MYSSQQVSIKCPVCGARIADTTAEVREQAEVYEGKKCPPKALQIKCHSCKHIINIKL